MASQNGTKVSRLLELGAEPIRFERRDRLKQTTMDLPWRPSMVRISAHHHKNNHTGSLEGTTTYVQKLDYFFDWVYRRGRGSR